MSTYQTNAKYRERHKENGRSRYRNETPEARARRTAKSAAWREKNAESYRLASQRSTMIRRYGITPEQRDAIFEAQGRCCACCRSADPGSARMARRHGARFAELLAYLEVSS